MKIQTASRQNDSRLYSLIQFEKKHNTNEKVYYIMYPGVNATNISIALTDSALAKAWVIYYSRRSPLSQL